MLVTKRIWKIIKQFFLMCFSFILITKQESLRLRIFISNFFVLKFASKKLCKNKKSEEFFFCWWNLIVNWENCATYVSVKFKFEWIFFVHFSKDFGDGNFLDSFEFYVICLRAIICSLIWLTGAWNMGKLFAGFFGRLAHWVFWVKDYLIIFSLSFLLTGYWGLKRS
jgi:hypothetical protein